MVGIEAGATGITLSTGERVEFDVSGSPENLLQRVADDFPYVRVSDGRRNILQPAVLYATLLADALRRLDLDEPIAIAVPGWWSRRAVSAVEEALADRGAIAVLLNDAEAAVAGYRETGESLPENVAVVSMRSRITSVVVVRNCRERPTAVPSPTLVRGEGGRHLDATVLQHLLRGLADLGHDIDTTSAETIHAAREALEQCRDLREALSSNATESVQPRLPGVERKMLLVRSELDELAEPWADAVLSMVRTALEQCSENVDAVLLAGGLAAMPLISQRISADLALEVHVPEDLRLIVARGAESLVSDHEHRTAGWRGLWQRIREHAPTSGLRGVSSHRVAVEPRLPRTLVQR